MHDVTKSENRTEVKNKSNTLLSKFQSEENKKKKIKRERKKLSDIH